MYQDFSEAYENNSQTPKEDYVDTRACGCGSPQQQWQGKAQNQGGVQGQIPTQGQMQNTMQGQMGIPSMQIPYNINQPGTIPQAQGMPITSAIPTATAMQQQPTGPSAVPDATFSQAPGSPVFQGIEYIQGYLRTFIGRYVKIDFLVGTNSLVDREGILLEVGVSYVVLRESQSDDNLMCDIFSIKFVRVYY
ncbi:MAG: hypothetical protein GX895_09560 [Clostridiales bacterium]|uniref:hypothetical protein n=1 Tax=Clostridium sp. N3C TaxID=1776758 RepID=UPI00092E0045|nr:hypothetical protein [Clostridium sp. N3C]NLZ49010.1 hypothetical protein [Clostridiales bacterium]SCN23300.1 hypothetical protein N3C_1240 [Clostridium sp. N3C]